MFIFSFFNVGASNFDTFFAVLERLCKVRDCAIFSYPLQFLLGGPLLEAETSQLSLCPWLTP
jgi:hypothetical protein